MIIIETRKQLQKYYNEDEGKYVFKGKVKIKDTVGYIDALDCEYLFCEALHVGTVNAKHVKAHFLESNEVNCEFGCEIKFADIDTLRGTICWIDYGKVNYLTAEQLTAKALSVRHCDCTIGKAHQGIDADYLDIDKELKCNRANIRFLDCYHGTIENLNSAVCVACCNLFIKNCNCSFLTGYNFRTFNCEAKCITTESLTGFNVNCNYMRSRELFVDNLKYNRCVAKYKCVQTDEQKEDKIVI